MSAPGSVPSVALEPLVELLLELLAIPSPSGFTDAAVRRIESELDAVGVPHRRTPKGALLWTLPGRDEDRAEARALASHVDTLGAVVKEVKANGRLRLSPLGSFDWGTVEGAEVTVHPFRGDPLGGTVVNTKQSSHVHGSELRELRRRAAVMEVRLDAVVAGPDDVAALGVGVGDAVSFDSAPRRTPSGHVKGRHLDNKAAVAICLAVTRAWVESGRRPHGTTHFFVSNYEEVGHGAAAGIPAEIAELLCVDMAAVGGGQRSSEHHVTLCVKDRGGPYDPVANARLRKLAEREGIDLRVDVYPYYSSDATAAWRAGGSYRAALIGPGVDASHAFERTHEDALQAAAALLSAYLGAPLA